MILPLQHLQVGESGRVQQIDGEPVLVHRLAEMGLRAESIVRMVRAGEPCIVQVNNHRLSLRGGDQLTILVEIVPQMAAG